MKERKKNNRHSSVIFIMAGILGFEPRFTVLETVALPLNYTPILWPVSGYVVYFSIFKK